MPVTAERAAETVTGLKMPMPFFFAAAAVFLQAATRDLNLCWPFFFLPPTKRAFLTFFFLRRFFFFFFFFFFGFLAFFAFFALGFLAAFFAGFFFFAAVCVVRARLLVIARFTTVVSVSTRASSNTIVRRVEC